MGTSLLLVTLGTIVAPHAPYVFVPDDQRTLFRISNGGGTYYGRLDKTGEFVLDRGREPVFPPPGSLGSMGSLRGEGLMNASRGSNMRYEFRSGLLVPGKMERMRFVPEEAGVVIHFFSYDLAQDPRFIYNLPGRLEYTPQ